MGMPVLRSHQPLDPPVIVSRLPDPERGQEMKVERSRDGVVRVYGIPVGTVVKSSRPRLKLGPETICIWRLYEDYGLAEGVRTYMADAIEELAERYSTRGPSL